MRHSFLLLYRLIVQLALVLAFYTVFRLCFYTFNSVFFTLDPKRLLALFVSGIRFDLSAILLLNSPFILLSLWPFPRQEASRIHRWRYWLFLIPNGLAFLFEIADWEYFAFNRKRSTAGVFDLLGTQGDFINLLPAFLRDFWYLFIVAALAVALLGLAFRRIEAGFARRFFLLKWHGRDLRPATLKPAVFQLLIFIPAIAATLIGIRGGLQLVPVNIRNALEVARPEETPLVLNTPFSILHSFANTQVQGVRFMDSAAAWSLSRPLKHYGAPEGFRQRNIVIIILESFSRSFTSLGGARSYTPFLDSLMTRSRTFTRAFANGLHSADAVPAILAGIPALLPEPFGTSLYANNTLEALPLLLKPYGYYSAFFHGASNGSMSFDVFSRSAGYDAYFGRSEYPDAADYDGNWGIYDGPFFRFFGARLDAMPRPFHATLFTLSSHHPFSLPRAYRDARGIREQSIFTTIEYTDAALADFFREAETKDWFRETLFVLVADHEFPGTPGAGDRSGIGPYGIPLLFYAPGDSLLPAFDSKPVQQIDILPGILDYLNYPDTFFALGSSPFDPEETGVVIQKMNEGYQWISKGFRVEFFADSVRGVYAFPHDSPEPQDLLPERSPEDAVQAGKAFIQVFNHALLEDKMAWRRIQK